MWPLRRLDFGLLLLVFWSESTRICERESKLKNALLNAFSIVGARFSCLRLHPGNAQVCAPKT